MKNNINWIYKAFLLSFILSIIFSSISTAIADKFNIDQLIEIVKSRIQVSNSISELNFIKETIINEYNKYKNNSKQIICHIDIKELKNIIKERQEIINNT